MPPDPVVTEGVPDTSISPPVVVPMAVVFPAFKVTAEEEVFVVVTFCESVKLPVPVSTRTVPEAIIPLPLPTVPITKPPLASKKFKEPNGAGLLPPARVPILLFKLARVNVPVPINCKLAAENPRPCVTEPGLSRVIVPPVVRLDRRSRLPFNEVVPPSRFCIPFKIKFPLVLLIGACNKIAGPAPS